jgi:hypothetical protein
MCASREAQSAAALSATRTNKSTEIHAAEAHNACANF